MTTQKKTIQPALCTLAAMLLLAGCSGSGDSEDTVAVNGDVAIAYAKRVNTLSMNPTDGAPFAGASLSVLDANGTTTGVTTNDAGAFTLADVPQGACTVTLTLPTGFHAVDPASGSLTVTIVAEATTSVTFSIAHNDDPPPPPVVNNPMPTEYWRREVRVALRGNGEAFESIVDMSVNFPQTIFDQFARRDPDPLPVQGVTQVDPDGAGPLPARRLTLVDMENTLAPGHQNTVIALRRELLTILLNVVSNRLSLGVVLEEHGVTVAERIEAPSAESARDGRPHLGRMTRGVPAIRTREHHRERTLRLGPCHDALPVVRRRCDALGQS